MFLFNQLMRTDLLSLLSIHFWFRIFLWKWTWKRICYSIFTNWNRII